MTHDNDDETWIFSPKRALCRFTLEMVPGHPQTCHTRSWDVIQFFSITSVTQGSP